MSMAKISKQLNLGVEAKAADILYDSAQECDLSLTAFVEKTAYLISRMNKQQKKDFFLSLALVKEPDQ